VFELGDEIQTFNYAPLVKVKSLNGISRIVEVEDADDSYTDSLEEGDSENYLGYIHNDGEGENENAISQNKIDLCDEWNRNYKWDEKKKEFNLGWKRVQTWIAYPTALQMNKAKKENKLQII
jgi:hypothetical protein